jgi:L-lactate utilization protein LutB
MRYLRNVVTLQLIEVVCIGCGRCVEVCHGDIGMPNVVEIVRRNTAESERHEPAAS